MGPTRTIFERVRHEELPPEERLTPTAWYTLVALCVLEGPFGDTDKAAFHISASWALMGVGTIRLG